MMATRIGAMGAAAQAALWLSFIGFVLVINPLIGLANPRDLDDAAKLLPVLDAHPAMLTFPALDGLVGLSLLTVVIVMHHLGSRDAPATLSRTALGFGVAAAVGFIALSLVRVASLPVLAGLYSENVAGAGMLFELTSSVYNAMSAGTRLALGAWLVLSAIKAKRLALLPSWLALLGGALGVVNIVSAYVPVLAAPNLVLMPLFFGALAVCLSGVPAERYSPRRR